MEETNSYSLEELSALSGFDRRVIRSFIEQGLLKGPESMGRYARYSSSHLTRLLAIRNLREQQGLTLGAIRTALVTMSEDELNVVANKSPASQIPESSALDYLRAIQGSPQLPVPQRKEQSPVLGPADYLEDRQKKNRTPIDILLWELSKLHVDKNVRRQAKSARWHRIAITPDIELSIRGIDDAVQLANFERIADHLREILLGGHYE